MSTPPPPPPRPPFIPSPFPSSTPTPSQTVDIADTSSKRGTAVITHHNNLAALPKLDLVNPFGQGSKAGACGIWAADVPAIRRSFELIEGLSMVRRRGIRLTVYSAWVGEAVRGGGRSPCQKNAIRALGIGRLTRFPLENVVVGCCWLLLLLLSH